MPTREALIEKARAKTELANLAKSRREAWMLLLRACTRLELAYTGQEELIQDFSEEHRVIQEMSTLRYDSLKAIEEKARKQADDAMTIYDSTPAF